VTEQWNLCEEEKRRKENSCYNEARCLEHGCDCFDNSRYEKREDNLKSDRHEERDLTIEEKINKIRKELNLPVKNEKCFVEEKVYEKDDEKSYLPFYNRYSRPATATSSTRSPRPKVVYKSRSRTQSRSPSSSKHHWVPTGANYYYGTHNNRSRLMQNLKL
jgi:hypothetical protein